MSRILVLFAHPAFHRSRVQRALAEAAQKVDGVTFHDLYEEYVDFHVNVDREQRLLREHERIVFQHPMYWYSSPALLKQWIDLVLEQGFAYGDGGTALRGKRLLSAMSAGGAEDAYRPEGYNFFTMEQLLTPFEQTARLCGMRYEKPFVVHGSHALTPQDIAGHAEAYRQRLKAWKNQEA